MTGLAVRALQQFVRRPETQERCELCGAALGAQHDHLLELEKRRLACACQACAILFPGDAVQRYKRVPARIRPLPDFRLTDAQWAELLIPINMAFFYAGSISGKIAAVYPSPAGAVEADVPAEMWREIAAANRELDSLEDDVEALLVNRLGEQRGFPEHQYFLLPIDRCFQLVGLVRTNWRGLSGGDELWQKLGAYFQELRHA